MFDEFKKDDSHSDLEAQERMWGQFYEYAKNISKAVIFSK